MTSDKRYDRLFLATKNITDQSLSKKSDLLADTLGVYYFNINLLNIDMFELRVNPTPLTPESSA